MTNTLFPQAMREAPRLDASVKVEPRVLRPVGLEGLLRAGHRARIVWEFVEGLDLGPMYAQIRAVEGHAGRPAIDPAILMALWLYATVEGVRRAREIARLCEAPDAYRWICGGVSMNDHTLADCSVAHGEYLDEQLTTSVATLMDEAPTGSAEDTKKVTVDSDASLHL